MLTDRHVSGVVRWVRSWLRSTRWELWACVVVDSLPGRHVSCFVYFASSKDSPTNLIPVAGDHVDLYRDGAKWKISLIDRTGEVADIPIIVGGQ